MSEDGTIVLEQGDMEFFHASFGAIREAQALLGAEYDRHLVEVERLKKEIEQRRVECQSLVDLFARKYVRWPGKFDFRPEVGAFVRVGEKT